MNESAAYQKAISAYNTWILSLYLQHHIKCGVKIPYSLFSEELTIKSGHQRVATIKPLGDKKRDIDLGANNLEKLSLGTCFLVFNDALDQVFGDKPNEYSDSDTDALRAILFT